GNPDAQVGDISKQSRQHSPEQWIRHMNEVQSRPYQNAVANIDHQLCEQIAADSLSRIIENLCLQMHAPGAPEPNQAITEVFTFDQHENHKHNHDRHHQNPI